MPKEIKLNAQGLSRKNSSQQRCFLADEGKVLIAVDLISAEPAVTAHYSRDPNYLDATLHMIGKRPYFAADGLLKIDDIYLMVASRFPSWAKEVRDAFENYYDGVQGFDVWLTNPEKITKGVLKKIRNKSKPLCLGISYGLGPKKMVLVAQANEFDLTIKEARAFRKLYWDTFSYVKMLGDKLAIQYNSLGHIQNDFGYCLYPSADYKVLNSLIQSSVSGVVDVLSDIVFNKDERFQYVVCVHDEIIFQIPEEDEAELKEVFYKCVDELNDLLKWSVQIRLGWETSKTFDIGK
jgi:DNA polymerase I-like protein with 3'-5' exonuclease and polymerase domains